MYVATLYFSSFIHFFNFFFLPLLPLLIIFYRVGVLCLALPIRVNGVSWGDVVGGCMCGAGMFPLPPLLSPISSFVLPDSCNSGVLNIILLPFVICMEGKEEPNKAHRFEDEPPSTDPSPMDNSVGSSKHSTYNILLFSSFPSPPLLSCLHCSSSS